ncbi:3-phosphoshikimate 1-carboxyvinyltransferase [Oceanobacillus sp. 143]|uniref:3-phosphoshikimate 1-carboxyvinyltransferase n=1 Tax=Oceanobacillus zhaokaii TaxID=2052660 RepID=A0A345PH62_9BACI|nr:3-phosphoshikimate 1-carboxyvinyltransferase [Oceanobacillus zhaokaii]AXI09342.1 3-phosphoshikimate 1-carboxyvinyltransferase [Oceanobacillus zhaokaii]QGS69910.1 3-phosphoshikimate 1-carboxyvinyltransferase [Oceanobacillus sp. 143]
MATHVLAPFNKPLLGELEIPGDKSISHRAVILGSIANGTTKVSNFLDGEDCMRTVKAFQLMGVSIEKQESTVIIDGKGSNALQEPLEPLYFGNSGTTTRLMLGILAGLPFFTTVYGDASLTERPMDRVIDPLREMNATIDGRKAGSYLPLSIKGNSLQGITYTLPVKSAQVKSAILLAGLFANGETKVIENTPTRNHTENMLQAFGAAISSDGSETTITNIQTLTATNVYVPGDISSAAFFLVAGAIVPGSKLTLKNVGLNQTRTGIIDVLLTMGADLQITNQQVSGGEEFGDLTITYKELNSIVIQGEIIPRLIDEIPVLALLATQIEGTTVIRDAEELRVKETDRINAVVDVLTTLGANIEATDDGMVIHGKTTLTGGEIKSYNDHRIAMMGAIASLIAKDDVEIDDDSSIYISYPNFFEHLKEITV